jgi:hypothetical protein
VFCLRCKSVHAQPRAASVFALCEDCVHVEWHRIMIPAHDEGIAGEAYKRLIEVYGYSSIRI